MARSLGRVDRERPLVPQARPEDQWMPESERRQLERASEKFIELLHRERNEAFVDKLTGDDN